MVVFGVYDSLLNFGNMYVSKYVHKAAHDIYSNGDYKNPETV